MTNPLKPGELKAIRRMSVRDFWKIRWDTIRLALEESLIRDGRFYGAEWVEEYDDFLPYIRKVLIESS